MHKKHKTSARFKNIQAYQELDKEHKRLVSKFADIASGKRLSAGIDHRCGQTDKSNSALKTFQSAFDPNRTHMAVSGKLKSLNHSLKKR